MAQECCHIRAEMIQLATATQRAVVMDVHAYNALPFRCIEGPSGHLHFFRLRPTAKIDASVGAVLERHRRGFQPAFAYKIKVLSEAQALRDAVVFRNSGHRQNGRLNKMIRHNGGTVISDIERRNFSKRNEVNATARHQRARRKRGLIMNTEDQQTARGQQAVQFPEPACESGLRQMAK